jgi:pyruvate kinase
MCPSACPALPCALPCPVLCCSEFEVDFISLSYCRSAEDVHECRDFLASIGAEHTKVGGEVGRG